MQNAECALRVYYDLFTANETKNVVSYWLRLCCFNFTSLVSIRFNQVSNQSNFMVQTNEHKKIQTNSKWLQNGHILQLAKQKPFFSLSTMLAAEAKSFHVFSVLTRQSLVPDVLNSSDWFIYFTCHYFINFIYYFCTVNLVPSSPLRALPFACLLRLFHEKRELLELIWMCNSDGSWSSQASWWIDLLNQINRNIYFANNSTKLWP